MRWRKQLQGVSVLWRWWCLFGMLCCARAQELTTAINARNESRAAGLAEQNGGRLAVLKAPPPVAAAGNDKRKGRGPPMPKPK